MSLPTYDPMLATPWPAPFDDPSWAFDIKWDGYRAIVSNDERIRARSRRGLDLLGPFPELMGLPIPEGVVLDGEVVAFDPEGRPSFSLIQRRTGFGGAGTGAPVAVNYVVFDLLHHGGEPLVGLSFRERRARLDDLGLASPLVVPEPTVGEGETLFDAVRSQGFEGVVAKRLDSTYQPGRRSPDWRKVSVKRRMRAVVGGYVSGEGSRARTFGSLLLGLWDGGELRWIGAVGSGFKEGDLVAIHGALAQIERDTSPFGTPVVYPGRLSWVEPGIVVNVEFKEWTHDHHLRAPVYKGVEQVDPETATWEAEGPPL